MTTSTPDFTVVGAGLAGALMACYLAREGSEVRILERRTDPRIGDGGEGRSINLAISTRGLHALAGVDLQETVLAAAVPMRGRMVHAPAGHLNFQRYGNREQDVINSVSRAGLNSLLLGAAEASGKVEIEFGCRLIDFDLDTGALEVHRGTDGDVVKFAARTVIGADGAFSAVRSRLQRVDRFDFRQDYLEYGYKELTIPAAAQGGFEMEPNALHIWPRGGSMMIALPNCDGSFTCTLFWPLDGPHSFSALQTVEQVGRYFSTYYADAVPLMPDLGSEYLTNPTSSLVTVRCGPWFYGNRAVLIGDAAHAVVPFYGQGANAAFADCPVLTRWIREHPNELSVAFDGYFRERKVHVDALADLAIANFVEMRDHVSSPVFRGKKRMERALHRLFPRWFIPLYSLVSFSLMPYEDAVARARRQTLTVRVMVVVLVGIIVIGALWLWN